MIVKKFDISNGLTIYEDVKLVRVKHNTNNYLIMEDHAPMIGKINGSVTVITKDDEEIFNIKGYFMNKNNTFELIVEEILPNGKDS